MTNHLAMKPAPEKTPAHDNENERPAVSIGDLWYETSPYLYAPLGAVIHVLLAPLWLMPEADA